MAFLTVALGYFIGKRDKYHIYKKIALSQLINISNTLIIAPYS